MANDSVVFSIQQSVLSPRHSIYNTRKDSSSSSSSSSIGRKSRIQTNIIASVAPNENINKFVENNTSASRRFRMNQEEKSSKQIKFERHLLFRESSVNKPESRASKLNASIKKMIDDVNNNTEQPIVYGKHIDNLTTELFVALSNGIDKNAIMKRTHSAMSHKDKSTSCSVRTSSTNLNEFYDIDQNDDDNFVIKICNEIKNCQLENDDGRSKSARTKSVKIVEPIEEVDLLRKSYSKTFIPDSFQEMEKLLNYQQVDEKNEQFPASYFDPNINDGDYNYRYKKVLNNQFQQIFDQFDGNLPVEVLLKQTLSTNDYFSSLNSSNAAISHNENPRKSSIRLKSGKNRKNDDVGDTVFVNKDYEMYNILKRMMVKKKYEAATIKYEKGNSSDKQRKRRCQSSIYITTNASNLGANSSNSSSSGNIKIKTRPVSSLSALTPSANSLSNIANSSILSKPFTEDDDEEGENLDKNEDYTIVVQTIRCVKCKKKFKSKQFGRDTPSDGDLYDEFKISNETLKKNEWPYELDTNDEIQKKTKSKLFKCYSCANIPVKLKLTSSSESHIPIDTENLAKNKKPENIDANKNEKINGEYQSQTYNSARRALSAKSVKLVNQELTDKADKDEFHGLKCSHPRKMTTKELVEFQRRSSLIPGKTFTSQRRQSITLNRPPLSKIKADYDKENPVSYIYPLVKFSSASNVSYNSNSIQNEEVRRDNFEVNTKADENEIVGNEKFKDNKKLLKNFKIDPFIPSSSSKLRLHQNEQYDQMTESKDFGVISALHIYKTTSRIINKRPKTAK
jgi:hypothetical protein